MGQIDAVVARSVDTDKEVDFAQAYISLWEAAYSMFLAYTAVIY